MTVVISLACGVLVTWMLAATGTDGDFFRSLLYPWTCAAVLLAGVILGAAVPVRTALALLVPFSLPQPLLALWQGMNPRPDGDSGLWAVGFTVSALLLVFSVGCVAIGVCVRLMFRR
ncbi:hypothetical protein Sme01_43650 [Sphaerisporangium melleum]|uniref:Uncharacterized protein n=1 Tax=Sphaerisporangium melleum TaxID=321316 RepID=A0A917VHD1_9ACTN|nr:hypothetical protein GCM10007964_20610 [Sphaerisporangium melleum]GII71889.1 hypothetical protein Sme01_43650 [Sphaerisporangium melleum]